MEYTLALALEDYLPVIFSAIGLGLLARMVGQMDRALGRMALIGVVLTISGGLLKATWKLIIAASGIDIVWMSQSLFPLMGPGFTLMAWSIWQARRVMHGKAPQRAFWLVPTLVIVAFVALAAYVATAGGPWRLIMLAMTTLANFAILLMLAAAAWRRKMWPTGGIFCLNLVIILMLSQMAQMEQTIAFQWTEQLIQTASQGCFALAAWQISRRMEAGYRQTLALQPAMG